MKKANIADLRSHLSELISEVENGEEIQIQKRNVPVARIIPMKAVKKNATQLGIGKGTVKIKTDLTRPAMDDDWEMLK